MGNLKNKNEGRRRNSITPFNKIFGDAALSKACTCRFAFLLFILGILLTVSIVDSGNVITNPLDCWIHRLPPIQEKTLHGITYDNNLVVAVGREGTILTSTDGANWITKTSGTTNHLTGVTYGGGKYVALGINGLNSTTLTVSTDGNTWIPQAVLGGAFRSITFGNGTFVMVGFGGNIASSSDLTTWTIVTPVLYDLWAITYGNGSFVAVGNGGTILTSSDGISWASKLSPTTNWLTAVTYGGGSTFVGVGKGGAIVVSTDLGNNWTLNTSGTTYWLDAVAYNSSNSVFVAVGENGTVLTSADSGNNWWVRNSRTLLYLWGAIALPSYGFVGVGEGGVILNSPNSSNGVTWDLADSLDSQPIYIKAAKGVTSDNAQTFYTVGENLDSSKTSPYYRLSPMFTEGYNGGVDWGINGFLGLHDSFSAAAYGNGVYVFVGMEGTILYGPNPWAGMTMGSPWPHANLYGVAFGNSTFMAVGDGGTIVKSSNGGVNWSTQTSGTTNNLYGITYGNGKWVAVGYGGAILESKDNGASWSVYNVGSNYFLKSVTYGNNTFVAVGESLLGPGTGAIFTSSDAATWTSRNPGTQAFLSGVTYAPFAEGGGSGNTFVAVGDGGTVLTSTDGVTWTKRLISTVNDLCGVIYGNDSFVIVGDGNHVLQAWLVLPSSPTTPLSPVNGATNVPLNPTLSWDPIPRAWAYWVQVSTDQTFNTNVIVNNTTLNTSYPLGSPPLQYNTSYYWRLRPGNCINTNLDEPSWSPTWSFRTTPLLCVLSVSLHEIQ